MSDYHQEQLLAMELNRSHIGKLVQIITETWSLTGTLNRVDQHDNREWSIDYSGGRGLVPSGGEIYAELWVGPWRGDVIGNQPVTVETVRGTLEAPERARLKPTTESRDTIGGRFITDEEIQEAQEVVRGVNAHRHRRPSGQWYWCYARHDEDPPALEGSVVEWSADEEDLPPEPPAEWAKAEARPWLAANGNRFTDDQAKLITERLLYRPEE